MTDLLPPGSENQSEPPEAPELRPVDPAPEDETGHADADLQTLVGMPAEPGRATLAAMLLVAITDVFVLAGAGAMTALKGQPSWVGGVSFASLAILGYIFGLWVAVAISRSRSPRRPFAEDYGLRGLTAAEFGWALIAALAGRVIGLLWSVLMLALKVKLPGMELDPSTILPQDPVSVALTFVLFAGVAPFVEEVGFRGIMFGSLVRRMRPWTANIIAAALFAGIHFNLFGFVPIFVASLLFGWLFMRTRSLWTAIFAHAAFNGIGLAIAYLMQIKPGV